MDTWVLWYGGLDLDGLGFEDYLCVGPLVGNENGISGSLLINVQALLQGSIRKLPTNHE